MGRSISTLTPLEAIEKPTWSSVGEAPARVSGESRSRDIYGPEAPLSNVLKVAVTFVEIMDPVGHHVSPQCPVCSERSQHKTVCP